MSKKLAIGSMFRLLPKSRNELVAVTEIDLDKNVIMQDSWGKKYPLTRQKFDEMLQTEQIQPE